MAVDQDISGDTRKLVVFSIGETEYALPVTQVQEILRYTRPQPTASPMPWMCGVIGLRGSIVPVIDLAVRLNLAMAGHELPDKSKIVIVEGADVVAGAIVNGVDEVIAIPISAIDEVPSSSAPFIDGVARIDERLIMLLDADMLLAEI